MSFQIKMSGIDKNINKHMWIDIDVDDLDLIEECEYIRRNPNKIEESNKLIEEIENKVKNLSIYKPPIKKRKIEEKMDEIEEIENKIEILSLQYLRVI